MSIQERIVFIILAVSIIAIGTVVSECKADQYQYKLNLLPVSYHNDRSADYNERHRGVGLSVTTPDHYTFGVMHYTNSQSRDGLLVSASMEFHRNCSLCVGAGLGLAPAYAKDDLSPAVGWISFRYKWVSILSLPSVVTALVVSMPIN